MHVSASLFSLQIIYYNTAIFQASVVMQVSLCETRSETSRNVFHDKAHTTFSEYDFSLYGYICSFLMTFVRTKICISESHQIYKEDYKRNTE